MLLPLLVSLLQDRSLPAERAPVQSLVRVERGTDANRLQALGFDVAAVTRDGFLELVCDAGDIARLGELRVPYTVVHEDLAGFYASRLTPSERILGGPPLGAWLTPQFGAGGMGGYYTFVQVESVLDQIHAAYPTLTTAKFSIGTTGQGRTLWALKISDNPETDEAEPEMRFDAMHHAREPESMQCVLWMALALLERYGTDPLSTYLVNEREIWIVPCMNPDGYVYNQSTNPGGGGLWRKNRRNNGDGTFGVDLNRNYAFQWGFDDEGSEPFTSSETYRGPSPASEPEVAAMQAFMASRSFQTAISAHTYSDLWLSPWGYISAAPANAAQYDELGALATEQLGWPFGPAGVVLYLANGVTVDHEHAMHGTISFTPEIGGDGDGFWPATNRIVPLAQDTELPFLQTAWAAGAFVRELSRATAESDGDGFVEAGESFQVTLTLRNSGRAAANSVEVLLESSTPGITVTHGLVDVGSIGSFASASHAAEPLELAVGAVPSGTRVDYVVSIRYENFTQSLPGSFTVGVPHALLADDLEVNLGWTVGAPGDGATTGIWAYGDPVGAFNGSEPSNPENDASAAPGVRCFATGNGSTTAGGDDVDGGPTTLTSPRMDLAGFSGATLSYQRWFANATVLDDQLQAFLSNNDGGSWTLLETVSGGSANQWSDVSFALEDFLPLTSAMRVRFVTGDTPNNSITEAAVDEFSVHSFGSGPTLALLGRGALGTPLALHVANNAGQTYVLRGSPDTANIPVAFGTILIKPSTSLVLIRGTIPASGLARTIATVPNDASLSGLTFHMQALTVGPLALSNRASITFQ